MTSDVFDLAPPDNIADFVAFKSKQPEPVWTCLTQDCGCQKFYLHFDQRIECAGCGRFHQGHVWGKRIIKDSHEPDTQG